VRCSRCGTEVPGTRLSCPVCQALVHADELKRLAAEAEQARGQEDAAAELAVRRRMLDLLPPEAGQARVLAERVQALSQQVDRGEKAETGPDGKPRTWRAVLAGLFLLALTKGKLLLLGLTKLGTLSSMLLSLGVYWAAFGWPLAAGLIASIYVHEMGHVAALQRFGIRASLPMFLPGIGAVVRLQQSPANEREDARVGHAGPLWGVGAAVAAWLIHLGTGAAIWAAIARVGAWINLFNLLPVWQLDGGRGFRALSRGQRLTAAAAVAAAWIVTREGLLVLLALAGFWRAFAGPLPEKGDGVALAQYVFLIAVLSAFCLVIPPL